VPFETFDRSRLRLRPLAERTHDLDLSVMLPDDGAGAPALAGRAAGDVAQIAARVAAARRRGAAVIVIMGDHVIRAGVSRLLIDLARRGLVTHFAGNGAVAIHDFEFALVGATTESVARYIREGQFGLWRETGDLNDIIVEAAREGLGFRLPTARVRRAASLWHTGHWHRGVTERDRCRRPQGVSCRQHPSVQRRADRRRGRKGG
jgi:hypothetical protein